MSRKYEYRIIYIHQYDVQRRHIDERHPLGWSRLNSFLTLKEAERFVKEELEFLENGPKVIKRYPINE